VNVSQVTGPFLGTPWHTRGTFLEGIALPAVETREPVSRAAGCMGSQHFSLIKYINE
jgi:hypothetical protein